MPRCGQLCLLSLVLAISRGTGTASAATNDIFPGDYYAINPGDKVFSLYLFDRANVGPYLGGEQVADSKVKGRIGAIRGVSAFSLAGLTATAVAVLSWADLNPSSAALGDVIGSHSTGLGDLRLGMTIGE